MITTWYNGHFAAPSVERFFDELAENLREGHSLILVLPNGFRPSEVEYALKQRLDKRDMETQTLNLTKVPATTKPIQALARSLQIEWQHTTLSRTVENLLNLCIAREDSESVVFLDGFDGLDEMDRHSWLNLLVKWCNATHAIANTTIPTTSLCIIVQADSILAQMPESMLYLKIYWWWGIPSRIEVQLYCQSRFEPGDDPEAKLWRGYLLPHLVGNDEALLKFLWSKVFCDPTEFPALLACYAKSRWPYEQILEWGVTLQQSQYKSRYGSLTSQQLSVELRELWANGIINPSMEHGIEIHLAVAAQLGRSQEIYHRLWRGQAALLLPLLDQTRLTLCSYFTQKYGTEWPLRWGMPKPDEENALRENPLTCEWRYLRDLLDHSPSPREERLYAPLARQGLSLRNRLAHYQPVSYTEFQNFWREQGLLAEL